jgi:phosphomannomutase
VRPSGTESKVKCYFEVVVDHEQRDQAAEQLALLRTALAEATGTMPA